MLKKTRTAPTRKIARGERGIKRQSSCVDVSGGANVGAGVAEAPPAAASVEAAPPAVDTAAAAAPEASVAAAASAAVSHLLFSAENTKANN